MGSGPGRLAPVKADHFEQQKLLDLAAEDVALTQLIHRSRTLPEVAAVEAAVEAERTLSADVVRAETEVRDLGREVTRLESDVETVRAREVKDQRLLDSGSVSPKELTNLQHELDSLKRRQSDLEDQELELMQRLEDAEATLAAAQRGLEQARADRERAEQLRDDTLADIADEAARAEVAAGISAPLLSLYDRIRTQTGTTGAAMLRARACQGCRLELYGNELAAVRNADPHEVVRCENCGRILVRTAESGL
jgi:predicted  nucleic acid-binding Zn-ribbon protein